MVGQETCHHGHNITACFNTEYTSYRRVSLTANEQRFYPYARAVQFFKNVVNYSNV